MTHAPHTRDPQTLAAQLALWVAEFVVWLAETLAEGPLRRWFKRWAMATLARAERGAKGIVVLAAMKRLSAPCTLPIRRAVHPAHAPRGFACAAVRGNDMRRMTRHFFPRERDLARRARRRGDVLDALAGHAKRLARRIARIMPATRIAVVAAMTTPMVSCAEATTPKFDSS